MTAIEQKLPESGTFDLVVSNRFSLAQAFLAFVLWRGTKTYVKLTADLVATTQQQLATNQQQQVLRMAFTRMTDPLSGVLSEV